MAVTRLVRTADTRFGSYVWSLPVTTEPARALGDEICYPKTVANIGHHDNTTRRETTVARTATAWRRSASTGPGPGNTESR